MNWCVSGCFGEGKFGYCVQEDLLQDPRMSDEVASLRLEVATLREDLASLESEVRRLRQSLVGLRAEVSAEASLAGSVSQISEGDRSSSYTQVATPTAPGASVRSWGSTRPPVSAACLGRVVLSWADREAVCRRIGEWVRRCLEGQFRGPSGRDRIPFNPGFGLWLVPLTIRSTTFLWFSPIGRQLRLW